MELEKIEAVIEAVLFAMGDAVDVEKIAVAIGHDKETTKRIVHQMMDRYNSREGGMEKLVSDARRHVRQMGMDDSAFDRIQEDDDETPDGGDGE